MINFWFNHFLEARAEIFKIFCSYFGRNDDFINLFWDLLSFRISKYSNWKPSIFNSCLWYFFILNKWISYFGFSWHILTQKWISLESCQQNARFSINFEVQLASNTLICKAYYIYDIIFCETNQLWILGSVDSHWINDFNPKINPHFYYHVCATV